MADNSVKLSLEVEAALAQRIASFKYDFYGLVMFLFPWGQPGTALADRKGPEKWQEVFLKDLSAFMRDNAIRKQIGLDYLVWRSAVTSGHGVGKSALVSWLIYCFMSTRRDCRGNVTANTGNQLDTRTWPELAKWHALALNRHWFKWTATSFFFAQYPEDKQKNYMTNALTFSENNTEAFQGLHNDTSAIFTIMDEAGGIRGKLWEVVDGTTTDGEPFLFAFGNPTQPEGEFFDCFNKHAAMYYKMRVDSRSVSHTNKQALGDIVKKYGEDSDEVRIRVEGKFPSQSYNGLFTPTMIGLACSRELFTDSHEPLIMAVDVARFGRDSTVIGFRRGRDARSIPFHEFKGLDNVQVSNLVMRFALQYKPDAIVIESVGPGVGVIDICRSLNLPVHEIHPGAQAEEFTRYFNRRAEYYVRLRDWMIEQGCMQEHKRLHEDLLNVQYKLDPGENRIKLESKKELYDRSEGRLPSPDFGDTLALTFAVRVARRGAWFDHWQQTRERVNYNPIADEWTFLNAEDPYGRAGAPYAGTF